MGGDTRDGGRAGAADGRERPGSGETDAPDGARGSAADGTGSEPPAYGGPDEPGGAEPELPDAPADPAGAPAEEVPGRRLSVRTVFTSPLRRLGSLAVPLVVLLFFGGGEWWSIAAAAAGIGGTIAFGWVRWFTFRYQVFPDRLEIHQGLIGRSTRRIPLDRIRGVDVTSNLIHRAFGLAVVKVEAAAGGSTSEEGSLDAVSVADAERLRVELLRRRAQLVGAPAGAGAGPAEAAPAEDAPGQALDAPEPEPPETVYQRIEPRWYFYAPLSLGYLLAPFAVIGSLLGIVGQNFDSLGLDPDQIVEATRSYERQLPLVLAGAAAALAVLMPVSAVVTYAAAHWNFSLRRRGDALVTSEGLFTRRSVTLEQRRIRGFEYRDNPMERLFKVARLRAVVTGLGGSATRAQLLPIAPRARVEEIAGLAVAPYRGGLTAHPPAARVRRLFRAVVPVLAVAAAAALLHVYLAAAVAALVLLAVPLGLDRYRALGHGFDGERLSVRSGSLDRRQVVLERDAVIGCRISQTLFQRRVGLATLTVAVGAGGGAHDATDMAADDAAVFGSRIAPELFAPFAVPSGEAAGGPKA
ncbi:PH domain-containing protein [Allonocardiopsis opalescens]|uniref:Putative membrane protein n=1 Tax=Allonocardiopsis opalescens TaxID=1144618 RepID=A0A2T0PU73_9ACTN|nr:PH domain-containing protein [Allonocardiopsis opalescens]PRX92444.1 putative membrane protein [Allonocardiopsis opalescens]